MHRMDLRGQRLSAFITLEAVQLARMRTPRLHNQYNLNETTPAAPTKQEQANRMTAIIGTRCLTIPEIHNPANPLALPSQWSGINLALLGLRRQSGQRPLPRFVLLAVSSQRCTQPEWNEWPQGSAWHSSYRAKAWWQMAQSSPATS